MVNELRVGFFWGGTSLIVLVWAFFRLPETKGRSFEQLDVLFARKVPARRFKTTEPEVFNHIEVKDQ